MEGEDKHLTAMDLSALDRRIIQVDGPGSCGNQPLRCACIRGGCAEPSNRFAELLSQTELSKGADGPPPMVAAKLVHLAQ